MRVAAQDAARSLARIREVDERAVNTEMALARETRDKEDALKRAEANRVAGEESVRKVEELLEETRGMYAVAKNEREALRTTVKELEAELRDAHKREEKLSTRLASAEATSAEVSALKATLVPLQNIEKERDAALEEK